MYCVLLVFLRVLCYIFTMVGSMVVVERDYVCPRCGMLGTLTIEKHGDNEYYYVVHSIRVGNKKKTKKCYLGAVEYKYVQYLPMLIQGRDMALRGIPELDHTEVIKRMLDFIEDMQAIPPHYKKNLEEIQERITHILKTKPIAKPQKQTQ